MNNLRFRVWDKGKGKMNVAHRMIFKDGKWYINHRKNSEDMVLMQYIGIKDRDGNLIYEGDIIRGRFGDKNDYDTPDEKEIELTGLVRWDYTGFSCSVIDGDDRKGMANYFGFTLESHEKEWNSIMSGTFFWDIEVLGNKYESPELLQRDVHQHEKKAREERFKESTIMKIHLLAQEIGIDIDIKD